MSAYYSIEGLTGAIFFLGCVFLVIIRANKASNLEAIDFAILSMGLVHGLIFPLVVAGVGAVYFPGAEFIAGSAEYTILQTTAASIAVIGLYFGWRNVSTRRVKKLSKSLYGGSSRGLEIWFFIMLLAAFATQYLYTRDYGGFFGYFSYNRLIRAGLLSEFERSRFSFLQPFGDFSIIASLGFFGLLLSKERGILLWFGFLVSIALSSYVLLAGAGRVYMVTFVAMLPMSFLLDRCLGFMFWFVGFFLMISIGMISIFAISNILDLKGANSLNTFLIRETSFVFVSFFAQLNDGYQFHLFSDVFLSPAYLAPSSLTSGWLSNASDFNTILIMGFKKGQYGVTGGIPTDLVTFGLMQFSFLGVLLYSLLFGYIMRVASEAASSFKYSGLRYVFSAYIMLKLGVFGMFYSFPQHIILSNFAVIAALLTFWCIRAIRPFFPSKRGAMQ